MQVLKCLKIDIDMNFSNCLEVRIFFWKCNKVIVLNMDMFENAKQIIKN